MESLQVLWEDSALNLLLARDRYASQSIRDEFGSNPKKEALEFDKARHGHVTNVANHRYSVIWYEDALGKEGRPVAIVKAVVPALDIDEKTPRLKEYVEKVVKSESKGAITLS